MSSKSTYRCLVVIAILIMAFSSPLSASYQIRIPREIEFVCEEGTGGYTGSYGVMVIWGDYPGASDFRVFSKHGAGGNWSVGSDVHQWSIGGGSPVDPGERPSKEANVNPSWYQNVYEIPMVLELNWYGAFVDPQSMYLYSLDILSVLLDQ